MDYFSSMFSAVKGRVRDGFEVFEERLLVGNRSLKIEKVIGEGGFSFVYLVRDRQTDELFALKKILIQVKEQEQAGA